MANVLAQMYSFHSFQPSGNLLSPSLLCHPPSRFSHHRSVVASFETAKAVPGILELFLVPLFVLHADQARLRAEP